MIDGLENTLLKTEPLKIIREPIGPGAPPLNNRYAWEHAYGGSHYLYNKVNTSLACTNNLCIQTLDSKVCEELVRLGFKTKLPVNFERTDGWKAPSKPLDLLTLDEEHIHYDPSEAQDLILILTEQMRKMAQSYYRCFLSPVKCRLITLKKGYKGEWHKDNFPTGIVKVLVYLSGCNSELGTTEINFEGENVLVSGPPGTVALFDTNQILHRALGPDENLPHAPAWRFSMELTFVPSFKDEKFTGGFPISSLISTWPYPDYRLADLASRAARIIAGGGRKPTSPQDMENTYRLNYKIPPKNLNIGGGAQFLQPGWANVDGAFGETNRSPVNFNPLTTIGFPDDHFSFIYTSHTLEHIDMPTVGRIIFEARRVLKSGGLILVKVPDVEGFLGQIDSGYVSNSLHRCLCGVQRSWATYGISFSAWQAVSFLACSAWNKQYSSDIFNDGSEIESPGRFFGPCPTLSDKFLRDLFRTVSPGEAARILRRRFSEYQSMTETDWVWGHQNAYSSDELTGLMGSFGFEAIDNDRDRIMKAIKNPPSFFRSQWDLSLWGLFRKVI